MIRRMSEGNESLCSASRLANPSVATWQDCEALWDVGCLIPLLHHRKPMSADHCFGLILMIFTGSAGAGTLARHSAPLEEETTGKRGNPQNRRFSRLAFTMSDTPKSSRISFPPTDLFWKNEDWLAVVAGLPIPRVWRLAGLFDLADDGAGGVGGVVFGPRVLSARRSFCVSVGCLTDFAAIRWHQGSWGIEYVVFSLGSAFVESFTADAGLVA